jgi:sialidase-1
MIDGRHTVGLPFNPMSAVRFISASALLVTFAAHASDLPPPPKVRPIPGIEKSIIVQATPVSPKNGEQTVATLKDGRLLLLWSEFLRTDLLPASERPPDSPLRRDPTGDDGYARISGMTSNDRGKTWSKPWVVVDDRDALVNCISPGLTRMQDGRLLLAYSWRSGGNGATNYGNCAKMVRFSSDEGRTWSERVRITPDNREYHTGCHDRAATLDSGRVLVQCHTILPPGVAQPGAGYRAMCMGTYFAYSDDNGRNWKQTTVTLDPIAARGGRFEEAGFVQRDDGTLFQLIRSWHGQSFFSESSDRGATWSTPRPSGIFTSLSPSVLARIPGSSDILLIWNPTWNPDAPIAGVRAVLACAVSRDGGKTWGLPKALEADGNQWAEYPGVTFSGDTAIVHYRVFPLNRKRCDLVQALVPIPWFYDERAGVN